MTSLPATGPEYVSRAEWDASRRRLRVRWLKVFIVALCVSIAGLFALLLYKVGLASNMRTRVLAGLAHLENYEVDIFRVEPSGKKELWRRETHVGSDWAIQLFDGKLTFVKKGAAYYYHSEEPNKTLVSYGTWDGLMPFVAALSQNIRQASPWALIRPRFGISASMESSARPSYSFGDGEETWRLLFDGQRKRPVTATAQGPGINGPTVWEEAAFSYGPGLSIPAFSRAEPVSEKVSSSRPLETFKCSGQGIVALLSADMNVRGDCFFDIKAMGSSLTPTFRSGNSGAFSDLSLESMIFNIFREHGDRLYDINVIPLGLDSYRLMFPADDDDTPRWPSTIEAILNLPGQGRCTLRYTFRKPTCFLLPDRFVKLAGDAQYLSYFYRCLQLRRNYLSRVYIKNGAPSYANDGEIRGYLPSEKHQREEVDTDLELIFLSKELYGNDPNAITVRFDFWSDCARVLNSLGSLDQARNALAAADDMTRDHPELQTSADALRNRAMFSN